MTDCSKCAIQKRLNENPDTKSSNTDALSRVIYEKINKLSGDNKEENEMNACAERIIKEKSVSKETAVRMCQVLMSKKKKEDY
jgi:hypothetical protein